MKVVSVDIEEAKMRLSKLIMLVEDGAEVILMDGQTPIARLVPVEPLEVPTTRVSGLHAGAVWTSEDFDEPLPDEFWLNGA